MDDERRNIPDVWVDLQRGPQKFDGMIGGDPYCVRVGRRRREHGTDAIGCWMRMKSDVVVEKTIRPFEHVVGEVAERAVSVGGNVGSQADRGVPATLSVGYRCFHARVQLRRIWGKIYERRAGCQEIEYFQSFP